MENQCIARAFAWDSALASASCSVFMSASNRLRWISQQLHIGRHAYVTVSYNSTSGVEKIKVALDALNPDRVRAVASHHSSLVSYILNRVSELIATHVVTDKGHCSSAGRSVVEFFIRSNPHSPSVHASPASGPFGPASPPPVLDLVDNTRITSIESSVTTLFGIVQDLRHSIDSAARNHGARDTAPPSSMRANGDAVVGVAVATPVRQRIEQFESRRDALSKHFRSIGVHASPHRRSAGVLVKPLVRDASSGSDQPLVDIPASVHEESAESESASNFVPDEEVSSSFSEEAVSPAVAALPYVPRRLIGTLVSISHPDGIIHAIVEDFVEFDNGTVVHVRTVAGLVQWLTLERFLGHIVETGE